MFGSKVSSFKDEVLTYEKYPIITPDRCIIQEHFVTIGIEKWCTNLVSALRYVLLNMRATPRMNATESDIKSGDKKILGSRVLLALRCIKIDSRHECNRFRLFRKDPIAAMGDGSTFKYFDTHDIEFYNNEKKLDKRIVNREEIAGLEIGQSIEIMGEVNRYDGIVGGPAHQGISLFSRDIKPEAAKRGKTYSGTITIGYEDNIDGAEMVKSALNHLVDIISEALKDDNIKMNYGNYSIEIEGDRSSIICGLIDHYIVANSDEIISTNKELINNKAIMDFRNVDEATLKSILKNTVRSFKGDIDAITNSI
jgi:hypothetical protein